MYHILEWRNLSVFMFYLGVWALDCIIIDCGVLVIWLIRCKYTLTVSLWVMVAYVKHLVHVILLCLQTFFSCFLTFIQFMTLWCTYADSDIKIIALVAIQCLIHRRRILGFLARYKKVHIPNIHATKNIWIIIVASQTIITLLIFIQLILPILGLFCSCLLPSRNEHRYSFGC